MENCCRKRRGDWFTYVQTVDMLRNLKDKSRLMSKV